MDGNSLIDDLISELSTGISNFQQANARAKILVGDVYMRYMNQFNEDAMKDIPMDKRGTNTDWNDSLSEFFERDMWNTINAVPASKSDRKGLK